MSHSGQENRPEFLPAPHGIPGLPAVPHGPGFGANLTIPASLSPTPNAMALLLALKRRWVLALTLGIILGASAAAAAWFLTPPSTYKATAVVHLSSTNEGSLLPGKLLDFGRDFSTFQKTQISVVKTQFVLNAALKMPKVANLPILADHPNTIEWLTKEIEADFSRGPEILAISLTGDRPDDLVILVNAIMEAYLKEFFDKESNKKKVRLDQLVKLQELHEGKLKKKKDFVERFAPKLGSGDPKQTGGVRELQAKQLEEARSQLLAVEKQLSDVKIDLEVEKKEKEKLMNLESIPKSIVDQKIEEDEEVKAYLAEIAQLKKKIFDLKPDGLTPQGKEKFLKPLTDAKAAKEAALEKHRAEIRPKVREKVRDTLLAELDVKTEASLFEMERLKAQQELLEKKIASQNNENQELGKDSYEMAQALADIESETKFLAALATEIRHLTIELEAPSRAQKLDDPVAIKINDPKQRMMLAGGAGASGLAAALVLVALWEFFSRRVKSVDEVAFGLGTRLVGALPAMPMSPWGRKLPLTGLVHNRWQAHFTESVDSYRTMLLHKARGEAFQVVMVSSAVSGEGKTSVACHLAVSLARAGYSALLVDADFRNPSTHRVFGLSRGPGLSELLRGQATLEQAVRPTPAGGAWILTAGESDLGTLQSLAQDGLRSVFENLKEQFDFIIVDSSPVLTVADAMLVAQHVDGVVFSARCDVSRLPKLSAAQHRLSLLGVPTLGAVVIGTGEDSYSPKYHWPVPA